MTLTLTAMKAKAFILSALLLVPATATAGAQVVNAAPAPAVVKITEANLPVALTDEELDEVTGEWVANAVGAVVGGVASGAAELARQAASGEKTNWGNAAAAAGIGAAMGVVSPVNTAFAASNIIKAGIAGGTVVGAIQKK